MKKALKINNPVYGREKVSKSKELSFLMFIKK